MKWTFLIFCILAVFTFSATQSYSQEIFGAVISGDLNKTSALLEEHPEWVNATSWGGWTPLHRASQFGHGDIVDFLISKGSQLEARTNLGVTPLYAAIIGEKSGVVKQLIDKGADVFSERNDGETLLHIAAALGLEEIVELLISKGLEVDVIRRYGITPLHLASVFGHQTTVEALISNGADIHQKNDNGSTALHLALAAGESQTAALLMEKGASDAPEEYVKITGEYLGQKKPGSSPMLFAPGILLNTHRPHGSITFSPDGTEIYWAAALDNGQFQKIWMMQQVDGQWSQPAAVPFSDPFIYGGPAFSPDGDRLFFDIAKPSGNDSRFREVDIGFFDIKANDRSHVHIPGSPLNSDKSELGPSVSQTGTVYFYSFDMEGGFGSVDIYCSRLSKDGYEKPENMGDAINTEFMDTVPFIAPDESYLLFSSMRTDGYGDFDLYVSYKKKDGTWTKARNMGETINTPARESTSVVSPDGKYLFFMSRRNGIGEFFWIDAKIIELLKPNELK